MAGSRNEGWAYDFRLAFSGWNLSWKGLLENSQGEWWLVVQLFLVGAHLLAGWPSFSYGNNFFLTSLRLIGILAFLFGIYLALRSFLKLGASLSPLPEPKLGAMLVTGGVYSKCRHPLYQSLLICSLGLAFALLSLLHLFLFFLLALILRKKAIREESSLKLIHAGYSVYMIETPAIVNAVPFLDWRR